MKKTLLGLYQHLGNFMKILNLYAGIGGNRKLWGDEHEVTAIESDAQIAYAYHVFFPKDKVICTDAHQYLLEHHKEFDFIWSSPPCQSHSVTNHFLKGQGIFRYPDMKLWQEIIFLKHFFKGKYVVENVKSYYKPMKEAQRRAIIREAQIPELTDLHGLNLMGVKLKNKRQILRNCVYPELGLHIFQEAFREYKTLL